MEVLQAVRNLPAEDPRKARFQEAIGRTRRALDLYKGGAEIALSFNGGKDSTVVLHLLRAAVKDRELDRETKEERETTSSSSSSSSSWPFLTFFFPHTDDFPEITTFVSETERAFSLGIHSFPSSVGFKEGLEDLVQSRGVRAIVIGTRSGDPNAKGQNVFCPSSESWPAFMRVNPILDWSYADVWSFLLLIKADYCGLYDSGFTSLGSTKDTKRNEGLLREDGTYEPAHALVKGEEERAGRAN